MYDEASAVFVTSDGERVGTTPIHNVQAHTHSMQVEKVFKGDLPAGNVRVSSMPITCTDGNQYPDGDPLDTDERIIVFATMLDGEWFTITPADGMLPHTLPTIEGFQN